MDPELKKELDEIRALARDNHGMLRAIHRTAWITFSVKVLFWTLVLIVPIYFLQPYLEQLPSVEQVQKALEIYQVNAP